MNKDQLINLGFVAHPHGIKGEAEIRLQIPGSEDNILEDGMKVWLFPSSAKSKINSQGEEWTIRKIRYGNKIICTFEGMKDRTHLETLIPFEIYLDRESFPALDDGEFYLIDLVGMDIVNEEGEKVGILESLSDNGMQELFNVRLDIRGELLTLPYVDAFFPSVDVKNKKIVMVMPEYTE